MLCLTIEIVRKTFKNVIISSIYRPARGHAHKFLDKMIGFFQTNFKRNIYF